MRSANLPFVALGLAVALSACSKNELSRGEATKQLQAKFMKDQVQFRLELTDLDGNLRAFGCVYEGCPDKPFENFAGMTNGWNRLIQLQKLGLVEFRLENKTPPKTWNGKALFEVSLTKAGMKYAIGDVEHGQVEVRLRQLKDIEIAGIGAPSDMMGKRVSVVPFTARFENTPFAPPELKSEVKGNGYFVQYDDGWRLEGTQ